MLDKSAFVGKRILASTSLFPYRSCSVFCEV